jgi:hypothetical protein
MRQSSLIGHQQIMIALDHRARRPRPPRRRRLAASTVHEKLMGRSGGNARSSCVGPTRMLGTICARIAFSRVFFHFWRTFHANPRRTRGPAAPDCAETVSTGPA